ncbi:MAG: PAS domain-containing protein [Rhizobiales bacterium]|nr:PAS domain-containing protein [Hyphomicrobiales bacterium]
MVQERQAVQDMASDTNIMTKPPGAVLHPGSRAIFRHWEAIRGESPAPDRDDLDLRQLGQFVSWLFIMERSPRTGGYVWRLAGSKVCELWRRELTGSEVLTGWDRFEFETIQRLLNGVSKNLQPCTLRLRLTTSLGRIIDVEVIALPMRARDGSIHVFGGVLPFRDAEALGHERIASIDLSSARTIWTEPVPGDHASRRAKVPLRLVSGGSD